MFRNLQLYRINKNWDLPVETLQARLATKPFTPCGSQDLSSRGWVSPTSDDRFVLASGGHYLITLKSQAKILPAAVINERTEERAQEIEAQQGYKPGRKQKREIKEAVVQELLPRAFVRSHLTHAWIDLAGRWLIVDASTAAKAEEVLEALRDVLDELPLAIMKTEISPVTLMADWLSANEASGNFTIDQDCELRAVTDEKATVRYVRHALDGEDVRQHLAAGKLPTRLALTFDERVSFILTEKTLELKRLAFLDVVMDSAKEKADTTDLQIEADFALLTGEVSRLLAELSEILHEVPDTPVV